MQFKSRNLVLLLVKQITLFSKILAVSVHESKGVSCCSQFSLQALEPHLRSTTVSALINIY